jgi:hypothetical protein
VANEEDGIGTRAGHAWESALCKMADFIGVGLDPFLAIRASHEVFEFKRCSSGGINDPVGSMGCCEKGHVGVW